MAARGRGGKTSSLTHEQLQAMGYDKEAMTQVKTVPPPTFPTLPNKPTRTDNSKEDVEDMEWKEDFLKYLHESPYYKPSKDEQVVVVSLGAWEKLAEEILGPKKVVLEEYNRRVMPKELQMTNRKRKLKLKQAAKAKLIKAVNPDEKLKALEEKEKSESQTEKSNKTGADDSDEDENAEEQFVADEEMDDENDYGGNYFDNGEAYNEEDDNLDDGPIY